jgi:hypothetical protein
MLTLKVITTDLDGQTEIHILNGDSISHREYFSEDHYIISKVRETNSTVWILGNMVETSSKQKFIVSEVKIHDKDRYCKNELFITPKADCWIMDNGKTVDSFSCQFEQEEISDSANNQKQ